MDSWELILENIGCFNGEHCFRFETGTNIITGPNAAGKTSLLNAFQLLLPKSSNQVESHYLNSAYLTGKVQLKNGDKKYSVKLVRSSNGAVSIQKKQLLTDNEFANDLVFLSDDHKLMDAVIKGDFTILKNWFVDKTDLIYYEKAYAICSKLDTKYRNEKDSESKHLLAKKHSLKKELESVKKDIIERKSIFEQFQLAGISEVMNQEKIEEYQSVSKNLEGKKTKLNRFLHDERDLRALIPEIQRKKTERELELTKIGEEFSSAKERIPKINEVIENLDIQISGKERELRNIRNKIVDSEKLITNYRKTLAAGSNECYHCGSIISQEALTSKISSAENDKIIFTGKQSILESDITELKGTKRKYANELQNLKIGLPKEQKSIKKLIQTLKNDITRKKNNLKAIQDSIAELRIINNELEEKHQKLQAQILAKSEKKQEIMNKERELKGELVQLERILKDLEEKLSKNSAKMSWLNVHNIRRRNIKQILLFLQNKIVSIQDNILNTINIHLGTMLKELNIAGIREIKIDDSFNIKITRNTGISGEFKELSGFERRLIALFVGFSVKNAFLGNFPLFIIDESLHAADDERFHALIDYIGKNVGLLIVTRVSREKYQEGALINQENIIFRGIN